MGRTPGSLIHLRASDVSVVIDTRGSRLPAVLYWGPDLGTLSAEELTELDRVGQAPVGDSRIDVPERVSILPSAAEGWVGRPGIVGSRRGRDFSPAFTLVGEDVRPATATIADGRTYWLADPVSRLTLEVECELAHSGLFRVRAALTNVDELEPYDVQAVEIALPVPSVATELLDLAGRHARERVPQRTPFTVGSRHRESRQGKPGLDGALLLVAGTSGFGFTVGQVWGVHVGWSGNQLLYAERMYNGLQVLGAGEMLLSGEMALAPGETYRTPWVYASHGAGLNGMSARFHEYLRARPHHPRTDRPVILNTWEAVYFDQDLDTLLALAEAGAAAGAERFVLDDGWFRGRRDDRSGLGDWSVDESVWPDGLDPLIDAVHALGMQFGLWWEPEMINLDSDLARAHPEWIFRTGDRVGIPSRHQYVLDLGHPEAYAYIAGCIHTLLDRYPIASLKWDHNRMVLEAGHSPSGTPGVHRHTEAVYRLLAEIRDRHPHVEIESCAGGGGRIDLGILEHTDRVWASDCIDPLERQQIQRYTQLLLPPELIGTHVGSPMAHTTHRVSSLNFRAATAIWGHMGIEWNLTGAGENDRVELAAWVVLHKDLRELLHTGRVVVVDHPDPAIWVHGVVSQDGDDAIFAATTVDRSLTWPPGRVLLPGLGRNRTYDLTLVVLGDARTAGMPQWAAQGARLTGRTLALAGVQLPSLYPESTVLIRAVARADGL